MSMETDHETALYILALSAENAAARDKFNFALVAANAANAALRSENIELRAALETTVPALAYWDWAVNHPNKFAEIINDHIKWGLDKQKNDAMFRAAIDEARALAKEAKQ